MKPNPASSISTIDGDKRLLRQRIIRTIKADDGTQHVTLECGHSSIQIIPVFCTRLSCAQCIGELIEEYKDHAKPGKR